MNVESCYSLKENQLNRNYYKNKTKM